MAADNRTASSSRRARIRDSREARRLRLNLDHEVGRSKAQGFRRVLGVEITDLDYLAEALRVGILTASITDVRDNAPFGVLCEVRIPVLGLREHRDRTVAVTTSWELRHPDDAPRLVTAYIDG